MTDLPSRSFNLVRVGEAAFEFDVMIYGGKRSHLRPLLICHSIEFPVPPSEMFCGAMQAAGLQVIFVRRAGFGRSSPLPQALVTDALIRSGATAMAEAVMMRQLMTKLGLSNAVLLAMGSSNLVAYRLVKLAPEITFTVFTNPVFNQDIFEVFTPDWFRAMLKQIVTSKSGLKVAIQGMKLLIRKDLSRSTTTSTRRTRTICNTSETMLTIIARRANWLSRRPRRNCSTMPSCCSTRIRSFATGILVTPMASH